MISKIGYNSPLLCSTIADYIEAHTLWYLLQLLTFYRCSQVWQVCNMAFESQLPMKKKSFKSTSNILNLNDFKNVCLSFLNKGDYSLYRYPP